MLGIKDREPTWSLAKAWNDILDQQKDKEVKPRDYMWASELGNSDIDIYLAMNGTPISNVPDVRVLRKWQAGIFWEWIAEIIARRMGIMLEREMYLTTEIADGLKVTGRADIRIGGEVNEQQIVDIIKGLELAHFPEEQIGLMKEMQELFVKLYGNSLFKERLLEVKSASSFMYEAQYKYGEPAMNHALQCYHYLRGSGINEGAVFYISKDDMRLSEIPIWLEDEVLKEAYESKIKRIAFHYNNKIMPEKEPLIVWSMEKGKFSDNWNIKYSRYLTYLYEFEHETDYTNAVKSKVASWNRVVTRIKNGDNMTKSNLEYLEEMKKDFPNVEELIANARVNLPEEDSAEMEQE